MSVMTRREANAALNAARTNLSSQLMHEMRSHLNQIIGYSEMLTEEDERERADGAVSDVQKISHAGHQMLALLEEHFTAGTPVVSKSTVAVPQRRVSTPDEIPGVAPGAILVVDDDETNRDVLMRRLTRQGHSVRTASSGAAALELMRGTDFDAVLLDIMMPEMDGYEVLGLIKGDEAINQVPVIMISAVSEVQSVVRCIEAGAEDYLTKPFDATLLKARINASLDKKRGRDREAALFEQLEWNYKQLKEVEKLRDDMKNMIVHDLRTPLTAVLAGVEMLGKFGELNETQTEMMKIATAGGRTLLGMINDLLDVEKMESGSQFLHYATLSPRKLVTEAVEQVRSLALQSRLALEMKLPVDLPSFEGDEGKLSRTLVNLIANAVKFTRAGAVTVSASHDTKNVRFAIRDTGEGISSDSFEKIFQKFGQLDSRNRVGTGLGLAFCKLAVEAHGGTISVESTRGVGSTFSFTIPLVARSA